MNEVGEGGREGGKRITLAYTTTPHFTSITSLTFLYSAYFFLSLISTHTHTHTHKEGNKNPLLPYQIEDRRYRLERLKDRYKNKSGRQRSISKPTPPSFSCLPWPSSDAIDQNILRNFSLFSSLLSHTV